MTKSTNKIWAVVPAAGSSRRMGGDTPKQYLSVVNQLVIEHTLTKLIQVNSINTIVVALNQNDHQFPTLSVSQNQKVETTWGGKERSDSVLAALKYLQVKAVDSDWVLVHDAARCCVRVDVITAMLEELNDTDVGGILGVPASDTLKRVNESGLIETTLDRSEIWQAQTPQVFRYGLLMDALQLAKEKQLPITDEASAVELMGHKVKMCLGHYDNIKITHPDDLIVAAAVLQSQVLNKKDA